MHTSISFDPRETYGGWEYDIRETGISRQHRGALKNLRTSWHYRLEGLKSKRRYCRKKCAHFNIFQPAGHTRLEIQRNFFSNGRISISRHNRGALKLLETSRNYCLEGLKGEGGLGSPPCRERPVSRQWI